MKTNQMLLGDIKPGMFITAFYGILDISQNTLQFVNAGHNQLIIVRQKTKKCEIFDPEGMPLGLPNIQEFEKTLKGKFVALEKGDLIIQYTDGITEAKNVDDEEYEMKRLITAIEKNQDNPSELLIKAIMDDVNLFCGEAPQYDDIAIIAIRV